MRRIQEKLALLYAQYLGTVPFFTFCLLLIIIGVVAAFFPKFAWVVLVVSFISQTVIQLLSLPALQIMSMSAEKQRQEDHEAVMAIQKEVHILITELHTLHFTDAAQ